MGWSKGPLSTIRKIRKGFSELTKQSNILGGWPTVKNIQIRPKRNGEQRRYHKMINKQLSSC